MLGNQGLFYRSQGEICVILKEFESHITRETEYEVYADPERVMGIFQKRFLCLLRTNKV